MGQASKPILVSVKLIRKTNDQFSMVLRLKAMHLNVWSNGNHNRFNEAILWVAIANFQFYAYNGRHAQIESF